jgi:hypothetical protein
MKKKKKKKTERKRENLSRSAGTRGTGAPPSSQFGGQLCPHCRREIQEE